MPGLADDGDRRSSAPPSTRAEQRVDPAQLGVAPDDPAAGQHGSATAAGRPAVRSAPTTSGGQVQLRVLAQDLLVQAAELRPGIEAELVGQPVAQPVEVGQGVGLPAGAVEREQQRGLQPLAKRLVRGQGGELAQDELVPAEGEVGPDGQLLGVDAQVVQPARPPAGRTRRRCRRTRRRATARARPGPAARALGITARRTRPGPGRPRG